MLSVTEFLDMQKIEELRLLNGEQLDKWDNFSWHIALHDGSELLGTARLYKRQDGVLFIDRPYLYNDVDAHWEMLTRTLLLKAQSMGGSAVAYGALCDYAKFGFGQNGKELRVRCEDITFPRACGGGKCSCG